MKCGDSASRWRRRIGLALILIAGTVALPAASPPLAPAQGKAVTTDLIVHEWGTFLGMNGSDGAALDGMYHEEHALPAFVHSRGRDQWRLHSVFSKGETPVIYFYTQNRQNVRVAVSWPRGVWTHWYPQAGSVRPSLEQQAAMPERHSGGRICWAAEVIPASAVNPPIGQAAGAKPRPEIELPATSSDALWNYAREVDAAFVKTIDNARAPAAAEVEKFLFYRGLGEAPLPLRIEARQGGTLMLDRDSALGDGVRHIFVLRVENGRGAFAYRAALRPGEPVRNAIPSMGQAQPLSEFTRAVADLLAAKLTESGLYPKEARAMVNTWKTSYFQTEGVRALFVLPRSWTDAFIPMTIDLKPREVVRVMVGRLELLTPERERLAEQAIRDLGDRNPDTRLQAYRFLREQGRYAEPIVRRVLKTTKDEQVRTLCRRLILSDLVTDLHAAAHIPADRTLLATNFVLLRAQLARLLREIGLSGEAPVEANLNQPTDRARSSVAPPPPLSSAAAARVPAPKAFGKAGS
jgi:hypothetical protein